MSTEHSPAVTLLTEQGIKRAEIRAQWKEEAGDLIDALQLSLSVAYSIIDRFSGRKFEQQSKSIEGRMSLTAQFLQGVDICEVSISEGLYSQAAALLKQELETIVAVDEFENNRRKEGKTPNVGQGNMSGFGPIYGDLNNIAHVSRHDLARQLVTIEEGEICAPTLIPQYNSGLARLLYGLHILLIVETAKQIEKVFQEIFGEGFSEEEKQWLFLATMILLKEEVIKPDPAAKDRFPDLDFADLFKT